MTLAEIGVASQCRVVSAAEGHDELQSRLYALGMYPGVELDVLRFAPTGDPIQIKIGATLMSIRKQEAALVCVEE
ncbi:MAG: ferrous iron transport protein A [Pseudomonadales bacterium]|nr:ferrous iron transport protein A [Pseudomonadales bacterium]